MDRHRSSLEGVIDFNEAPPLDDDEREEGKQRFFKITSHLDSKYAAGNASNASFNRPLLIKLIYEYSRSEPAQDGFLRVFFDVMTIPMRGDISTIDMSDPSVERALEEKVTEFGDYLMDNFFLPPCFKKTPQPSPASHSAVARIQGSHEFTGIASRVAGLRRACLERDRYRCAITRVFDANEATLRFIEQDNNAVDEDGNLLTGEAKFDDLQVAHIIPHALIDSKQNAEGSLPSGREEALKILNMFDRGVAHLVDGVEIDRPRNAMSLTQTIHQRFGSFLIYFTPVDGQEHTYTIDSFLPSYLGNTFGLPVTRALHTMPDKSIDPPSPRLLAIHRAIAHILHLSGAGEYIDRVLRDLEETDVRADGTTPLGSLVKAGIAGYLKVHS